MFIKYLKHEIRSTIKPILFISGLLIITGLLLVLTIRFNIEISFITVPAYLISLFGGSFYIIVCVVKSIYQRIFNKEGYLTLCLPLKIKDIVFVKIINATILYIIYAIGLTISFSAFLILMGMTSSVLPEFLRLISENFLMIIVSLFFGLISLILFISTLLFIMTVFNIKKVKNKVIMGILFFIGLSIAYSFIGMFDFIGYSITSVGSKLVFQKISELNYVGGYSIFNQMISIIAIVILNALSIYFIKNKLELD